MSSPSYYFASHRSTANPNSKEIDLLSPRQEKKLAKKANSKGAAVESEPEILETLPFGSKVEEFYSRPVNAPISMSLQEKSQTGISAEEEYEQNQKDMVAPPSPGYIDPPVGSLVLERKVPVKLEPKVFLAVERTFLLWMHSALWLLAAAMTIISAGYDDPQKLMYGVIILPVALGFICYALYQYIRRVTLLRRKAPGPYEDIAGPTILSISLMAAIVAQFGMKLYAMM